MQIFFRSRGINGNQGNNSVECLWENRRTGSPEAIYLRIPQTSLISNCKVLERKIDSPFTSRRSELILEEEREARKDCSTITQKSSLSPI